jgi:hypothetical protein
MTEALQHLLDAGLLEEVEPHGEDALLGPDEAERHLASAEQLAAKDPNGAFQLAYDAARRRRRRTCSLAACGLRIDQVRTQQPVATR